MEIKIPENYRFYIGYDINVEGSTFNISASTIQDKVIHTISKGNSYYHRELTELVKNKDLLNKIKDDCPCDLIRFEIMIDFIYELVLHGCSFSAFCNKCNKSYSKEEVKKIRWNAKSKYAGGSKFLCPKKHILLAGTTWFIE